MISVTLSQLTDILNGELQGADITLDAVTTDTRKLTPGCLFVALKGERFDAHDFADQAKAGGAGALLVSRPLDIDLPQLIVKDTRLAFGDYIIFFLIDCFFQTISDVVLRQNLR